MIKFFYKKTNNNPTNRSGKKLEPIDQLNYQKAVEIGSKQTTAFYATLVFFMTVSGWFFSNIPSPNKISLSAVISIIFLFLLANLSKISRSMHDNNKVINYYETEFHCLKTHKSSGLSDMGDFFHYLILTSINSFFILRCFSLQSTFSIIIITFILMLVFYYILGGGEFPICCFAAFLSEEKAGKNNCFDTKFQFLFCLIVLMLAFFIFSVFVHFS